MGQNGQVIDHWRKNFWTYFAILKVVPSIFDNPRTKYLIFKVFHECTNYISSYLPKLE